MARLHNIFNMPELMLRVMEEVDDYDDLLSLAKISKTLYNNFNTYQRSASARAMRQNFVAFDQALVAVRLTNRVTEAVKQGGLPCKALSFNTIDIRLGALGATTEEFKQMCALRSLCDAYLAQDGKNNHAIQKALTPFSKRFGSDLPTPANHPTPGKELAHRSFYRLLITGAALYRDFNLPLVEAAEWAPSDFLDHCCTEKRQFDTGNVSTDTLNAINTAPSRTGPTPAVGNRTESPMQNGLTPSDVAYLLQYPAYNPIAKSAEITNVYGQLNNWLWHDFETCADWNRARSSNHEKRTNKKASRDKTQLDFNKTGQLRELEAYILMQELFRKLRRNSSRIPQCIPVSGEPERDPAYQPRQDGEDVVERFLERKGQHVTTQLVPTAIFPDDFQIESFLVDLTQTEASDTVQRVPHYLGNLGVTSKLSTVAISDVLNKLRVEKMNAHRFLRHKRDGSSKPVPLAPFHLKVPELLLREQFGLQFHENMFSKTGLIQPWTGEYLRESGPLFVAGQFSTGLLAKKNGSLRYLESVDDGEYEVTQVYDVPERRKLPREIVVIVDGEVRTRRKIDLD